MKKIVLGAMLLFACLLIGEIMFVDRSNGNMYTIMAVEQRDEAERKTRIARNQLREAKEALALQQAEPRKIVMPTKTILKCPVHGITDVTLIIEVENMKAVYCKRCAMKFLCDLLNQNIPQLEVINENGTIKKETPAE